MGKRFGSLLRIKPSFDPDLVSAVLTQKGAWSGTDSQSSMQTSSVMMKIAGELYHTRAMLSWPLLTKSLQWSQRRRSGLFLSLQEVVDELGADLDTACDISCPVSKLFGSASARKKGFSYLSVASMNWSIIKKSVYSSSQEMSYTISRSRMVMQTRNELLSIRWYSDSDIDHLVETVQ